MLKLIVGLIVALYAVIGLAAVEVALLGVAREGGEREGQAAGGTEGGEEIFHVEIP